jgi:hypothetical protein
MLLAKKLSLIAGAIIDRNDDGFNNSFSLSCEIEEKLDTIYKEMPPGYWEIPEVNETGEAHAIHEQFNRLYLQLWFFQLAGFLHLPFMLRAATEPRYNYYKHSCLQASREVLVRYVALRKAKYGRLCSRMVDFGAFMATTMLVLDLIVSPPSTEVESRDPKIKDRALVEEVLSRFEVLSHSPREIVAAQSVVGIRKLLATDEASAGQNTRLTIPYLGTITIVRPVKTGLQAKNQQQATPSSAYSSAPRLTGGTNTPSSFEASSSDSPVVANHSSHDGVSFPPQNDWPVYNPYDATSDAMAGVPMISFASSQFPIMDMIPPVLDDEWNDDFFIFDSMLSTDFGGGQA